MGFKQQLRDWLCMHGHWQARADLLCVCVQQSLVNNYGSYWQEPVASLNVPMTAGNCNTYVISFLNFVVRLHNVGVVHNAGFVCGCAAAPETSSWDLYTEQRITVCCKLLLIVYAFCLCRAPGCSIWQHQKCSAEPCYRHGNTTQQE